MIWEEDGSLYREEIRDADVAVQREIESNALFKISMCCGRMTV
jgi:hypothetical protein